MGVSVHCVCDEVQSLDSPAVDTDSDMTPRARPHDPDATDRGVIQRSNSGVRAGAGMPRWGTVEQSRSVDRALKRQRLLGILCTDCYFGVQ